MLISYLFFTEIRPAEYNLFDRKQPVQEHYFPNPPILSIDWKSNDQGKIETYLVNSETKREIPVMYDLLPDNETLIEKINDRISSGYLSKDQIFSVESKKETVFYQNKTSLMLEEMINYFKGVNKDGIRE